MKSIALLPGAFLASSFAAHGAALLPGTKVGIDYGPTLTTNWNNFTGNGSKALGTVVDLSGNVSDLLAMTVSNGQFFNNDGTDNWVGLQSNPTSIAPNPKAPAEFVDSVTTDIAGNFSLGDATPFRLVVTGLNPYLAYKLDSVSAAVNANTEQLTVLGDVTYGPTAISRPLAVSQGLYHSFASVLPTTGGQLTFNSIDSGAGTNPIVNGVLIEALAPTAAGLLDNDADTMPNWWEVAYQFNPESNVDGGSADFDLDGVSNVDEFTNGTDPRNPFSPPPPTWAVDGDGSWNTPGNWSSGIVPNGVNRSAGLSSAALTTATSAMIALDVPVTLAFLDATGGKPFTLGAANALTFSTTSATAAVSTAAVAGSSLEMLGNVALASPLEVTARGISAITIGGSLTETAGPHAITKTGSGDLVLSGDASAFAGTLALNAGRLVLARPGAFAFDNALSGAGSLLHAGGGTLSQSFANTHGGGTRVINAGTLSLDNASPLGSGAVTLDDGTLHATADVLAGAKSLNAGPGGATVKVDNGFLLTTGGSAASSGTATKTGLGTWRLLEGGGAGTIGLLTVSEGTVDFNRSDTFGNHAGSQQDLLIGNGATVTNGTGNTGFNAFRNLTLSGGTLSVTNSLNALTGKFQAYGLKESITVTGSTAATINDLIAGVNGEINIGGTADLGGGRGSDLLVTVADVTGSAATDLTISAKLKNSVGLGGGFADLATGIIKDGPGTLLLSGVNRYTGDTVVNEGTLQLADNAQLSFVLGATSGSNNDLSGAGIATLSGDFAIDTTAANSLTSGSWTLEDVASLAGPYENSFTVVNPDSTPWTDAGGNLWTKDAGGGKTWTFSELTGVLTLTQTANFTSWAIDNGVTGGADGDSDFDGIPNLIEYALNLNPAGSDGAAGTFNGNLLSFTKRAVAVINGDITYTIQESDDLGVVDLWATVTPTLNDSSTITYQLVVGPGPRKFARLLVTQIVP